MRRIFWGFCRNWFLMSSLHYLSGRSDFGFEFAEIFVFQKQLPAITDMGSRQLSISVIRGVADSVSLSRGVDDSPHHRYREAAIEFFLKKTLCIDYTESRQLPTPLIG
jgi:hypothetical protein